jgi:HAD superfamily hydrolase (TIGR01549 family)
LSQRLPRIGGEPPLTAVIFDAGLTLVESHTPPFEVARRGLAEEHVDVADADLALIMDGAQAEVETMWHHGDWWSSESEVRRLFTTAYEHSLEDQLGAGRPAGWAARAAHRIYDEYQDARHWRLFADVLPTLTALDQRGVRMGVVSDWGHGLEAILLELELGRYFDFLVVSSRVGVAKPDPRVFAMALARVSARPEEAVYVGDTYVKDVIGARAAGIAPVLLDRKGRAPQVDCLLVRSLFELLEHVGAGDGPIQETDS